MRPRTFSIVLSLLVAGGAVSFAPAPALGASKTYYVDGKNGSDANSGLSWSEAFKTINHAARRVPHGSAAAGWSVVVRGYADYIYRERPVPGGYDRHGMRGAPLVFTAEGWAPGSAAYVKPIVSGGRIAPESGKSWKADATAGVWSTSWQRAPATFDRKKPYGSAIFQDGNRWLWQHASLADLRAKAAQGKGGYWYDASAARLYVATRAGVAPSGVEIEVPTAKGFYFTGKSGARYIQIRGFVIEHAAAAVSFHLGTDHSRAVDVDAIANAPMGFTTSGRVTGSGYDAAVGNSFIRTTASYNTLQGYKVDAGSRSTKICHSEATNNALQGIKIQGPGKNGDPRVTSGTEVCFSLLADQDVRRPGHPDEVPNGVTIASGARKTRVNHNEIRGNRVGIQLNQHVDPMPLSGTVISRNRIGDNRSVGINFRDGAKGSAGGGGSARTAHNVYWDNGVGIRVHPGSTNKTFEYETIFASDNYGIRVGCTCSTVRAAAVIRSTLVTHTTGTGIDVAARSRVTIAYTGLWGNGRNVAGSATKTAVNTRRPGYRSTDPADADFLVIKPTSFQYTAGPDGTPIGALY